MERVDDVSSRWLNLPVVSLHLVVIEEIPEEISLFLTHF